jgi:hypothetical protein
MVRPIGDIPGDVPAEVRARFAAAEARLYPLALADPDGYERVAAVIGVVADELRRTATDVAAVLEQRQELIGRVPRLAAGADLDSGGLPLDVVVDAASALRCRELGASGGTGWSGA